MVCKILRGVSLLDLLMKNINWGVRTAPSKGGWKPKVLAPSTSEKVVIKRKGCFKADAKSKTVSSSNHRFYLEMIE
ncbi:hypothetical protein KAE70_03885 [Bartonella henselae]|uniref:hypothetical protein n=2 Tax=Bartonella henselae TaxID=38323 RepID=UPI000967827A|nr:hypothetical protein [Bartonella henselae]OLL52578.1 hypothetical protein AT239_04160 [Bartonella henselae]OLL53449.1 hypothetical protein AT240_03190 [Bartonella henselae]UJM33607.1 hypothetical protein KAE70_03885 [Bartonella henselae]